LTKAEDYSIYIFSGLFNLNGDEIIQVNMQQLAITENNLNIAANEWLCRTGTD
jgi:hypothetical protein